MMKIKQLPIVVLCLGIFVLSGCDFNNLNYVGLIPEEDLITTYLDTIQIRATTVKHDSIFAKSTIGLLGEYYDPLYGRLNADYLCQFYCEDNFQFSEIPYENKIDSIYAVLYYYASGNTNSPFQFQIFPVTKPLDKVYYTNVNPADYSDLNDLWGAHVYTAANGILMDSVQVSENVYIYYRRIEILLPKQLGQKIYEETVNNPASFKTQQAFNEFFPGIYVTTGYGSGCMFNIQRTEILIDYKSVVKSSTGADSTLFCTEHFITTKEVIQLNRFENSDTEQLLAENEDYTFVKTPAGIYTRLVIPAQEIKSIIKGRIINTILFSVKSMPNEDWPYALEPPSHLLLLPEDSLYSFFHNRNIENNVTSFISTSVGAPATAASTSQGYNPTKRTYYFNDIKTLLAYHISVSPDDDLRLLLVPVNRRTGSVQSNNTNTYYTNEINNYLAPSGVKLRKDKDLMQVSVVTSKYEKK